jgi:hypothetical protein
MAGGVPAARVLTRPQPRSEYGRTSNAAWPTSLFVALDRLETLVHDRLTRLQYRPDTLDGFIAGTGPSLDDPWSP